MNRILILLLTITIALSAAAQDSKSANNETLYENAITLYDNGMFDRCEAEMVQILPSLKGMMKDNAYRIITLCKLNTGDIQGARQYVEILLKHDPYFTPSLGDPQRFIDLINDSKSKEAGITTASRQEESVDETPVPVTLITEEMIQLSGASNIQELLCLYVPGMTIAEGMETNIAMHGIYSLTQDKILFMVDGHRLNSSSTNAEAPDMRTSLDKIQQIEVLRGPASSLYGNVALTAVVNIITRKGAALNGGRLSAQIGTQNTYGGSFIVGGGNNVVDIMGWGSLNYSKGFKHEVTGINGNANTLYVQGYRGRPSYDIGIKGRWKDFTLSLNMQRSKRVPYINVLQLPADQSVGVRSFINPETQELDVKVISLPYGVINNNAYRNFSYDKYEALDGNEPGITRANNRINLDYSHSFGKFDVQASGYISFESTTMYNVLGDSIDKISGMLMMFALGSIPATDERSQMFVNAMQHAALQGPDTQGVYQKMNWSGITYGFQAQGLTNYRFLGNGSLIFGSQFEHFSLSGNGFLMGGHFTGAGALSSSAVFKEGTETSISGYAQIKHFFTPSLIFNAGIRYDNKKRFCGETIDRFSPRFSLIYKLTKDISLRGNYNYSFVDAPYIYRACYIPLLGGGSDMSPETMHSFNFGASYHNTEKHLSAEVGTFYNILHDLCIVNPAMKASSKDKTLTTEYIFRNAGKVRTIGIDAAMQYTLPRFFTNVNATWQRIMTSEDYIVYNSQTFSTPEFHTNATIAFSPYNGKGRGFFTGGKLWLRGTAQFQTKTFYQSVDLFSSFLYGEFTSNLFEEKPQCVCGMGLSYNWRFISLDLSLKNIFNNEYKIGSMLVDGVPHSGRSFLAKLTVKF